MTKKEFKLAIQRGLGRGILAVREEPERFRALVLWACGRNLAFDTQCEGTRAWYVYQMVCTYPDKAPFRALAAERLIAKQPDGGWDVSYYAELLSCFAMDGDTAAEETLWKKYQALLDVLQACKRRSRKHRMCLDDFEPLCVALSWREENYRRIANDVGQLFLQSKLFDAWDFAWLYYSREAGVHQRLVRNAKNSPALRAYLNTLEQLKQQEETRQTKSAAVDLESLSGRPLSVCLRRSAPERQQAYAEQYLAAAAPDDRARALGAFAVCPYPSDPTPVILDAQSREAGLREAAMTALAQLRHPAVRAFAKNAISTQPDDAVPILIKNYEPEDEPFLREMLQTVKVDAACKTNWHEYHMDILALFGKNSGVRNPPKRLLPVMYETTICSCCRETIVWEMARRRMISPPMWKELLFDCNSNIRQSAQQHLHRQNRRKE